MLGCSLNLTGFYQPGLQYASCIEHIGYTTDNFERAASLCGNSYKNIDSA